MIIEPLYSNGKIQMIINRFYLFSHLFLIEFDTIEFLVGRFLIDN